MGFHYTPAAGSTDNFLAAEVKYKNFASNDKKYELAFYNSPANGQTKINTARATINNGRTTPKSKFYEIEFNY
jgi:hypothetical protein